ncbi:unnamed protein product [Colletotrichum noveboracense]|uniref:Uncharacterized protein n=1 Tax=Colletotrichum noveboracense TaxID=2664923 RepID=A0A9W4RKG5_9PEZI|nr:unnamed protein product [Colletotrichum noveboracense]
MIPTHMMSARSMVGVVIAVPAIFALKHAWEVRGNKFRTSKSLDSFGTFFPKASYIAFVVVWRFQVCNIELQYEDKDAGDGPSTRSSIDFAYGSDQGRFAGAHRFSVIRNSNRSDEIRVVFESLSCNPTVNKPFAPEFALVFHRVYAMLLFQDSVASLVRDLNGV